MFNRSKHTPSPEDIGKNVESLRTEARSLLNLIDERKQSLAEVEQKIQDAEQAYQSGFARMETEIAGLKQLRVELENDIEQAKKTLANIQAMISDAEKTAQQILDEAKAERNAAVKEHEQVAIEQTTLAKRQADHRIAVEALSERDTEVTNREGDVTKREDEVASKEAAVQGREAAVASREAKVVNDAKKQDQREIEQNNRQTSLDNRESAVKVQENQVFEARKGIDAATMGLNVRSNELDRREADVTEHENVNKTKSEALRAWESQLQLDQKEFESANKKFEQQSRIDRLGKDQ